MSNEIKTLTEELEAFNANRKKAAAEFIPCETVAPIKRSSYSYKKSGQL